MKTYAVQVYNLIAQRNNKLSMQDTAALKTISEDQKRIALAATRDSAAMRTIAAITAVFLPATFTAVSSCPIISLAKMRDVALDEFLSSDRTSIDSV